MRLEFLVFIIKKSLFYLHVILLTATAVSSANAQDTFSRGQQTIIFDNLQEATQKLERADYHLVDEETFTRHTTPKNIDKILDRLKKNAVTITRDELHNKKIPVRWKIDWDSVTAQFDFSISQDGFRVKSKNLFKLFGPAILLKNTNTIILIELTPLTKETIVNLGIREYGLLKTGVLIKKTIAEDVKRQCVAIISNPFNNDYVAPAFGIQGDAIIHGIKIYQKPIAGLSVIEGHISERSKLPAPEKSDYPNCRFSIHFSGHSIISGEPCPKEMVLISEGFHNYKYFRTNLLEKGDKISCTVVPFDRLSEDDQATQLADDLDIFSLERYYVLAVHKIGYFRDKNPAFPSSNILFSGGNNNYISIFKRQINQPISEDIKNAQNTSINNDLDKMNALISRLNNKDIEKINSQFAEAWEKEKKKDPVGYNRVLGSDKKTEYVWRNISNSFWTLPSKHTLLPIPYKLNPETLKCFSSLKAALEANGVQLMVCLAPNTNDVSARVINREFRDIPDIQSAIYVKQLSEIGIETIYATDEIIENYNKYQFAFYPTNNHPFDTTQDVLTDIIADRLKRYKIPASLNNQLFSDKQSTPVHMHLDKFPKNCDISDNKAGSIIPCKEILYNGSKIQRTSTAQIITIGNSFMHTPMEFQDSIPVLISKKTCSPVYWFRVFAYGPFVDILVALLEDPEKFLSGKKVLIFIVGTDHLTTVNSMNMMVDVSVIDNNLKLLNNRELKYRFFPSANLSNINLNLDKWRNLRDKKLFLIKAGNKLKIDTTDLNSELPNITDHAKPILLVVKCLCYMRMSCAIHVNGQIQSIPSFYSSPKYRDVIFELPAETKEIAIDAIGSNGTVFAIKEIQVWQ